MINLGITERKIIKVVLYIAVIIAAFILAGFVIDDSVSFTTIFVFLIVGIPLLLAHFGLKSLRNLIWINICISGCLVFSLIFALWAGPLVGMFIELPLLFYAVIMLIINLISLFVFWVEEDSKAFIPLLISILTIPAAIAAAKAGVYVDRWLDDYSFKKHLPEYETGIKILEGKIEQWPFHLDSSEMPKEFQSLKYFFATGEKHGDNFSIRFCNRGGPDHAYFSGIDEELPENLSDWRKITAHWYRRY